MNSGLSSGNTGTFNTISRKEFLDDLPHKIRNTMRGVDLALVNEAITAIVDGNAKINGKKPSTRTERFIVISSYFKTAKTLLNTPFDSLPAIEHNYSVTINYKDKLHTYAFPLNPVEN
ncbi:MAG TPA: hypothetical protein VK806_14115 [Bacteroidia bacterium]|jgi:hypothetical protein|nr:hypothetical protein [Bacteroidia bacterium]